MDVQNSQELSETHVTNKDKLKIYYHLSSSIYVHLWLCWVFFCGSVSRKVNGVWFSLPPMAIGPPAGWSSLTVYRVFWVVHVDTMTQFMTLVFQSDFPWLYDSCRVESRSSILGWHQLHHIGKLEGSKLKVWGHITLAAIGLDALRYQCLSRDQSPRQTASNDQMSMVCHHPGVPALDDSSPSGASWSGFVGFKMEMVGGWWLRALRYQHNLAISWSFMIWWPSFESTKTSQSIHFRAGTWWYVYVYMYIYIYTHNIYNAPKEFATQIGNMFLRGKDTTKRSYLCPSVFCSNKLLDPPLKQVGDQRPRQRAAAFWPQPSWVLGWLLLVFFFHWKYCPILYSHISYIIISIIMYILLQLTGTSKYQEISAWDFLIHNLYYTWI